jgi:Ni,Fe-hydrogenase maturation factor
VEHHATPAGLLRLARVVHGAEPEAWLLRMGCHQFEIGAGLSAEADRAVSRAVEAVLKCRNLYQPDAISR